MEIINSIGRRKTSIARIFMKKGNGNISVNHREMNEYFPTGVLQYVVNQPLVLSNNKEKYDIVINVEGGGVNGQAEAIRLGISRALVKVDGDTKAVLKSNGLLTRDPRMVERKKPGQKKARKKFQFSKR